MLNGKTDISKIKSLIGSALNRRMKTYLVLNYFT